MHSHKLRVVGCVLAMLGPLSAPFADEMTYAEADALAAESQAKEGYSEYVGEFVQFNNSYRIDERGGCYRVDGGSVTILIIITNDSLVRSVLTDEVSEKAKCWLDTYEGIKVKSPPFSPFVIKMTMG